MVGWTPLECLPRADLTPSGLLQLYVQDGEVELLACNNTELRIVVPDGAGDANNVTLLNHALKLKLSQQQVSSFVDRAVGLSLILTTHRMVLYKQKSSFEKKTTKETKKEKEKEEAVGMRFIHLSNVERVVPEGGSFFTRSSYKILITTSTYGELRLVFRGSLSDKDDGATTTTTTTTTTSASSSTTISFTQASKDRDHVLSVLQKSLQRRAWEESARAEQKLMGRASTQIASRKVGVDAILTKNQLKHKEAQQLTSEVFRNDASVDDFMREARELVSVIDKYVATLSKTEEDDDDDDNDAQGNAQLADMLQDMGMAAALDKKKQSGGNAAYYQRLARQVVDFLQDKDRLRNAGGIMTLTDLYCILNRARGSNLMSPQDLLQAVDLLADLQLGIVKREFPSGVVVVQHGDRNDFALAERLKQYAYESERAAAAATNNNNNNNSNNNNNNNKSSSSSSGAALSLSLGAGAGSGGITALDAARFLKISAMLANEQLLEAERLGFLCRDVTLEGTRFFANRIFV